MERRAPGGVACFMILAAFALMLAAPAIDEDLGVIRAQDELIARVGYRLVTANAGMCERKTPASGLVLHGLEQYKGAYSADARRFFGLGEEPAILAVVPKSPAESAGIRPGDGLTAINGRPVPAARSGGKPFDRMAAVLDQFDAALAAGPVILDLVRAGTPVQARLTGTPACATRFQVKLSEKMNAAADGHYVEVNSGFLPEFENEDELAAIVAHELAHNILRHRAVLDAQGVSRGIFGRFGRSARRIRETEISADRYSLTLMANAGYRPQAAAEFWRRFEKEHSRGIFADATHLNGRRRADMLAAAAAELGR
jgi:beta-barrel assembly-enhancing protease